MERASLGASAVSQHPLPPGYRLKAPEQPPGVSQLPPPPGYAPKRRGRQPPSSEGFLKDLVTGESRTEFPDMPELLSYRQGLPAATPERAKVWAGASTAVEVEQLADIALKALQGSTRRDDKYGNAIITYEGKDYYVNQPGASQTDLVQLIGQAGWFTPGGVAAGSARTVAGRMLLAAPAAAGTSVATDLAAEQMGSEQGVSGERAATAAVLGPAFEALAPAAKATWRFIISRHDLMNPVTKELTRKGAELARQAGLDPEDMTPSLRASFAREMVGDEMPEFAMSRALSEEFDIPYTRGEASQVKSQVQAENEARQGVYGTKGQEVLSNFDKLSAERIETALQRVQRRLGGPEARTPSDVVETVTQGLRQKAKTFDQAIDSAYEYAASLDAHVNPGALPRLSQGLDESLELFNMSPDLYPAATGAVGIIKDLVSKSKAIKPTRKRTETARGYFVIDTPGRGPQSVSVHDLDVARKRLVKSVGLAKTPADREAAGIVKKSFDRWYDDVIEDGLFSGDPDALPALRRAIRTRAEKGRLLEPRLKGGKKDDVGTLIKRIIDEDRTGSEVAAWIIGSAKIGGAQSRKSIRVARRLAEIFGEDSVEYGAIREGVWLQLSKDAAGKTVSPRAFVRNLDEAFHKVPSLMNEMFRNQKQEIASLRAALKLKIPPRLAASARSAIALNPMKALRDSIRRIGTQMTFRGDAVRAWPVFLVGRLLPEKAGSAAAVRSIKPMKPPRGRAPAFTAGSQSGARLLDPELRPAIESEIGRYK